MTRSIIGITLFLILTTQLCCAQNDWRKGYIILLSGDTTYGSIDYRSNKSNSTVCYFRSNENDKTQKLSPDRLIGYKYHDGKFYVSKVVTLSEKEEHVFVEFLIKGEASIYYLKRDVDHYFIEKDGQLYELKNSEESQYINGVHHIKEKKEYIGVLNYLLQDGHIQNEIQESTLQHKAMIKIAKQYHEKVCIAEECIVYEKSVKPVKINFGLVVGANYTTLHLKKNLNYELRNEYSNYGGIALNFQNLPMIYERVSLQLELLANSYYLNDIRKYALNIPLLLDYRILATKAYPKVEFWSL